MLFERFKEWHLDEVLNLYSLIRVEVEHPLEDVHLLLVAVDHDLGK